MTDAMQFEAATLPLWFDAAETCPGLAPEKVRTTTGKSERTPHKHLFLDRTAGREAGTVPHIGNVRRSFFIDLCSGDGVIDAGQSWPRNTSVGLMAFHAADAADHGVPVRVLCHEKATATFAQLLASAANHLPTLGYFQASDEGDLWVYRPANGSSGRVDLQLRCVDSSSQDFPTIGKGDAAFIFNDPNSIQGWAANAGVVQRMVDRGAWVTTLHTMGCNVGGLLRLPREQRMGWNGYVDEVLASYDHSRQVCIGVRLEGDHSKWGYLMTYPKKWQERGIADAKKAFEGHRYPPVVALHGDEGFEDLLDQLFLTKDERARQVLRSSNA